MEEIISINAFFDAKKISEIFEQDSRRYNRALAEEQEAKIG